MQACEIAGYRSDVALWCAAAQSFQGSVFTRTMYTIIANITVSLWLWGGILTSVVLLWLLEARREPNRRLPNRPRPIAAFLFLFSLSFFGGLLKIRFHAWTHTSPSSWALMSLPVALFAAYREWSKRYEPKPPTADKGTV